jgi:hypothetical protein
MAAAHVLSQMQAQKTTLQRRLDDLRGTERSFRYGCIHICEGIRARGVKTKKAEIDGFHVHGQVEHL